LRGSPEKEVSKREREEGREERGEGRGEERGERREKREEGVGSRSFTHKNLISLIIIFGRAIGLKGLEMACPVDTDRGRVAPGLGARETAGRVPGFEARMAAELFWEGGMLVDGTPVPTEEERGDT
jgi:hypothetical protein